MSQSEYSAALSPAIERRFSRRETIFLEGDPVTHVLLLVAGCVKEMQCSKNGGEVILRLDGPGELVGAQLTAGRGRSSAAQSLSPSKLLAWDVNTFEGLTRRFPVLQRNAAQVLDERLAAMQQRFREVSTDTAASRVSNELLRLMSQIGQPVNGEVRIAISREELAQLTGTSLYTVSRLLSKWEERGIVAALWGAVLVRSHQALVEVAQTESRFPVRPADAFGEKRQW